MASVEVEDEEAGGTHSDSLKNNSEEDLSKLRSNSENFTLKAEEYLNSDDVRFCNDPKLKRERKKLEDLLNSYKKLINKLDNKFQSEEEKRREEIRLSKLPEIYALLQPEIYKNPREDEKARLIQRSSSRRHYTSAERILPPTCRTPVINLYDKRQEEKERFIKIISSAPARFLNTVDSPVPPRKLIRRPKYVSLSPCVINEREAEKERLSKILATSGIYYRKHLDQKCNPPNHKINLPDNRVASSFTPINKENMVRVGEYSPLSSKERHLTLRGFCDDGDKTSLAVGRRVISNNQQRLNEGKVDRAISTNDLEEVDEHDGMNENINGTTSRQSCNSISTQTDPLDICQENDASLSFHEKDQSPNKKEDNDIHSHRTCNDQEQVYYLSPREKLMSDLHGVSHCFPGVTSKISPRGDHLQDLKIRQVAYAKALQAQIEEKRKKEEERKRKEKEEEELLEQRIRLQQEKLEYELSDEQKKKQDWLAQRQSHEEVLRRRMLEMELDAQELKKIERRRRDSDNASLPRREPSRAALPEPYKPVAKKVSQSGASSISSNSYFKVPEKGKEEENRFDPLRLAPLLEADRQNVLSSYQRSAPLLNSNMPIIKNAGNYRENRKDLDKKRAENLLKAPLDFPIERPTSPPIPAVRTRGILSNNTKLLDDKWKVPKEGKELFRTQVSNGQDNILTQLGAFRQKLHQEHIKLEARLQKHHSQSP